MEAEPTQPAHGIDRWVIAAAVAAVLIRLTYAGQAASDPSFYHPIIDASTFHTLAQNIAQGVDAWDGVFSRPPLYPYVLAAIYALFGPAMAVARMFQAVLAGATCILTYLIGQRLFDRRVGLAGGFIVAAYGPMVFFDQRLLASALVVFCFTLALYAAVVATSKPTWGRWLLCGLAAGLAALARPNIAAFFVILLLYALVASVRRGQRTAWLGRAACLTGGTVAVIAPVTIRNYVVSGDFVPIAALGGMNLYLGNNLNAEQTLAARPGPQWEQLKLMPHAQGSVSIKASEDYFIKLVADYAAEHPAHFLRGLARKARLFFSAIEVPRNFDPYLHARYSSVLRLLMWRVGSFAFPFGVVAPLAIVGMVVASRRRPQRLLLIGYVLACAASVILFFNASRYRLPVVPVMSLFAAWTVIWLYGCVASRRFGAAAGGLIATLGLGVLINLPVRTPYDDINFEADLYGMLGAQLIQEQDLPGAEQALRKTLTITPESANLHGALSYVLVQSGRFADALRSAREAVRLDPTIPDTHVYLGQALTVIGEHREAEAAFRKAIEIQPAHSQAHAGLGVILANRQQYAAAEEQFRLAMRYNTREWRYDHMLAKALIAQCRYAEAVEVLRTVAGRADAIDAADELAWILATCPDDAIRDPDEALKLTDRILAAVADPGATYLDTRAAALAAAGRFDEAVRTATLAEQQARNAGQYNSADAINARRQAYERNQPVRDPMR